MTIQLHPLGIAVGCFVFTIAGIFSIFAYYDTVEFFEQDVVTAKMHDTGESGTEITLYGMDSDFSASYMIDGKMVDVLEVRSGEDSLNEIGMLSDQSGAIQALVSPEGDPTYVFDVPAGAKVDGLVVGNTFYSMGDGEACLAKAPPKTACSPYNLHGETATAIVDDYLYTTQIPNYIVIGVLTAFGAMLIALTTDPFICKCDGCNARRKENGWASIWDQKSTNHSFGEVQGVKPKEQTIGV